MSKKCSIKKNNYVEHRGIFRFRNTGVIDYVPDLYSIKKTSRPHGQKAWLKTLAGKSADRFFHQKNLSTYLKPMVKSIGPISKIA
jgi:hypothetical protein